MIGARLGRLVMICLIVEALYLILANVMLGTGILKNILNRRPEKYEYTWTHAWSIVPGVIYVRTFQMQNRSRSIAWTLSIDKARFRTALWVLPFRDFRIYQLKASGVEANIEKIHNLSEQHRQTQSLENREPAEIQLLEHYPQDLKTNRPQWHIDIRNATFDTVRSMKFEGYLWEGIGLIQGQLDMITRDKLIIRQLNTDLKNGQLSFQNTVIADNFQIHTSLELGPFIPRKNPGAAFMDYLVGNIAVEGGIKNFDFLSYYLKNIDWLSVHGNGLINANLYFDRGFLTDRSHLFIESNDLSVDMKGWAFKGLGMIDGEVKKTGDDLESILLLNLKEVTLCNSCQDNGMVSLPDINLVIKGKNIKLTNETPPITAEIDILETAVNDLSIYNRLFPLNSGFKILPGGYGSLAVHIELTHDLSQAELALEAKEIGLNLGNELFKGNCRFRTSLETTDPAFRHIQLKEAELRIDNMYHTLSNTLSSDLWSAEIAVSDTEMIWDDVINLNSDIHIALSHSQPLMDIFLKNKTQWFDDLIHFENLQGRAQLQLDSSGLILQDVTFTGDGIVTKGFGIEPFTVYSSSTQADLNNGFSNLHIKFNIPRSTIPDLSIINEYLPKHSGISIFPGTTGQIQVDVDIKNGAGKSFLIVSGKKTEFALLDTHLRGDPEIRVILDTKDVLSGRFDIVDTEISLKHMEDIEMGTEPDWWMSFEVAQGELIIRKPIMFTGLLKLKMRDTGPILSVFEDKNRVVSWLGDVFLIENIDGEGAIVLNKKGFGIDYMDLKGEHLLVKAKLSFSQTAKTGILYVKFRGLSVGVEMLNGQKNYKLFHPRRWFDRYQWSNH